MKGIDCHDLARLPCLYSGIYCVHFTISLNTAQATPFKNKGVRVADASFTLTFVVIYSFLHGAGLCRADP